MPVNDDLQVGIVGICDIGADQLRNAFRRAAWRELIGAGGDFTLIFSVGGTVTLVSSLYGVAPYYHALGPGGFTHGPHSADVGRRAGLPARTDLEALATLVCLNHTVDEQSLIENVRRLPARCVVRFADGRVQLDRFDWHDFHRTSPSNAADALDAFNAAVSRVAGDEPVVSISAGFDSRAILSSLIKSQRRLALLTMGDWNSNDAQAARFFAQLLGRSLTRAELNGTDYVAAAPTIAALTDGQKTADHWHGYFYVRGLADAPHRSLLIGSNGEFARSYYLKRAGLPTLARLAEIAPDRAKRAFWSAKLARHTWPKRYGDVLPAALQPLMGRSGMHARAERLAQLTPGGLRDGLDRFYLDQRVRHFIGYGLRLAASSAAARTPFLDRDWVESVWNLPRYWKTQSNWHRFAIAQNAPDLLRQPEAGYVGPMAGPLTAWQALRRRRAPPGVPYVDYRALLGARPAIEAVAALQPQLAPVLGEALPARVIDDAKQGNPDPSAIGLMLALGNWRQALQQ